MKPKKPGLAQQSPAKPSPGQPNLTYPNQCHHLCCCPAHGIIHFVAYLFCEGYRYRCYDINVMDPGHPKYLRGPLTDSDYLETTCCCLPTIWCKSHAVEDHLCRTDLWYVTYSQSGPANLVESMAHWNNVAKRQVGDTERRRWSSSTDSWRAVCSAQAALQLGSTWHVQTTRLRHCY